MISAVTAGRVHAREGPEALEVVAGLVERGDDGQPQLLAQLEVLRAAAGRDVDDARALLLADLVPGDDAVDVGRRAALVHGRLEGACHDLQVVEGAAIVPAHEVGALALLEDAEGALEGRLRGDLADPVARLALLHEQVVELGAHGGGDVGRHRPGRRRPHQEVLAGPLDEREAHREPGVLAVLVALVHLHLAHARAAAGAPGHGVDALVEPAAPVALREEAPDEVVVLVREGEVGAAQLGQAEAAHDHLDRVGDRTARPLDRDDLRPGPRRGGRAGGAARPGRSSPSSSRGGWTARSARPRTSGRAACRGARSRRCRRSRCPSCS